MHTNNQPFTRWLALSGLLLGLLLASVAQAADLKPVRVGVLQFGTVNWQLDVIKQHELDKQNGIDLQITPLGGKNATSVALQGGEVDLIVTDWLWVTRQRDEGRDYTFSPYSNAVSSLMVRPDANIKSLADLKDKKLGVAGGAVDKTWLLLRAYSRKTGDKQDIADIIKPQFGAPPLLNELALRGELDGAINFWHYAALLKAKGFTPLLEMPEILKGLGIERSIPLIGWVFSEKWANDNDAAIQGFLKASQEASKLMQDSDEEWTRLRDKMKADDDTLFTALRDGYREGIPTCFGDAEISAAADTFKILAEVGGEELVGKSTSLNTGTFWSGFKLDACKE